MKIAGKVLDGPREEVIVFPRGEDEIVFRARAVLDFNDFEKLCTPPEPPKKLVPGGAEIANPDDKKYLEALDVFAAKKSSWMILKSLEATKDLEWDTVDMDDPDTWDNFREDLKNSGFSFAEVALIMQTVSTACGLNQTKIEEATKRFLAGQAEAPESV